MAENASVATGTRSNGLAIAGFICGLVGVVLFWFILGPLAIIFGGIGWSRANRGAAHKGMSIAAVVIGALEIIAYVVLVVAVAKNGDFSWHVGG